MSVEIKVVVCRPDGTQIYEDRTVDESLLPTEPVEPEPTTEELIDIMLGVTSDE